ncbi:hypothetical protein OAT84_00990 [Gammaproteobacteria bacterium]|nr:hypothetical protein [Gammaproteobacteria bacterium]
MSIWSCCFPWRNQNTVVESVHSFNANSVTGIALPLQQNPAYLAHQVRQYKGYSANQGTDEGGYKVPVDLDTNYSGYTANQGADEGGYKVPVDQDPDYSGYSAHGEGDGDDVYAEANDNDSGPGSAAQSISNVLNMGAGTFRYSIPYETQYSTHATQYSIPFLHVHGNVSYLTPYEASYNENITWPADPMAGGTIKKINRLNSEGGSFQRNEALQQNAAPGAKPHNSQASQGPAFQAAMAGLEDSKNSQQIGNTQGQGSRQTNNSGGP